MTALHRVILARLLRLDLPDSNHRRRTEARFNPPLAPYLAWQVVPFPCQVRPAIAACNLHLHPPFVCRRTTTLRGFGSGEVRSADNLSILVLLQRHLRMA